MANTPNIPALLKLCVWLIADVNMRLKERSLTEKLCKLEFKATNAVYSFSEGHSVNASCHAEIVLQTNQKQSDRGVCLASRWPVAVKIRLQTQTDCSFWSFSIKLDPASATRLCCGVRFCV